MKSYIRTITFVLCKAVHDIFPEGKLKIQFPVSNGYYFNLNLGRTITPEDVQLLRNRMREIIVADQSFEHHVCSVEEAEKVFATDESKRKLLESVEMKSTEYYSLGGYNDYFYGPMLKSAGEVQLFGLELYYNGLLLRVPQKSCPTRLGQYIRQDKMFGVFEEYHRWQDLMHISNLGDVNNVVNLNLATSLIHVFEALQEKRLSRIADTIASRPGTKVVLIAGPSSSGKTTTCKRLSIQLVTNGIWPVPLSLDDYFLDREKTPKDENGEYDYESIYALNLEMFNQHLSDLIAGKEVEVPRYNFTTGKSEMSGRKLKMKENEMLVIEGIHALNPDLTSQIPDSQIFRVYASALTTLTLDDHNYIPTTDNRLLRRIIRDHKYRNNTAQDTLKRWASVRAGEEKWIFPYQENADAMFNTSMIFEISVIKSQAEPLLKSVPKDCPEYAEAQRLLQFLQYFRPIAEDKVPPTSLLREFLGGSSFEY